MIELSKNRRQLIGFIIMVVVNLLLIVGVYFSYQDFSASEQTFKIGKTVRALVVEKRKRDGTIKNPHKVLFCHQNKTVELSIGRDLFNKLVVNQEIELYHNSELKRYIPPDYNFKSAQNHFVFIWGFVPLFILFSTIYVGIKIFLHKKNP